MHTRRHFLVLPPTQGAHVRQALGMNPGEKEQRRYSPPVTVHQGRGNCVPLGTGGGLVSIRNYMVTQGSDKATVCTAGSQPGNILFLEPSRGPLKVPAIFCYGAEAAWIAAAHGFPQDSFTYQLLGKSPFLKRGHYRESIVQASVSIEEILPRAGGKKWAPLGEPSLTWLCSPSTWLPTCVDR